MFVFRGCSSPISAARDPESKAADRGTLGRVRLPPPPPPFLPRYFNVGRRRAPELGLQSGSSRPPVPDFVRVLFLAVPAVTFLWAPVHRAAMVLPGGHLMSARSWPQQLP